MRNPKGTVDVDMTTPILLIVIKTETTERANKGIFSRIRVIRIFRDIGKLKRLGANNLIIEEQTVGL